MTAARLPLLMGVVNVTPDSFSDGGRFLDPARAIDHALRLVDEGAAIVDIGGESTRPGADPVDEATELARVLPVIRGLSAQTAAAISIDTRRPRVARACVEAGASIWNDVSALTFSGDSLAAAMIARTIEHHFRTELRNRPLGIKTLSLFFVPSVADYRATSPVRRGRKGTR